MDIFFILEMVVGIGIFAVVIKWAYNKSRAVNRGLGLGFGQPETVRPATEQEVEIYEMFNKAPHGPLFVSSGYFPKGYEENTRDVKRRAIIAAISGGNHYAAPPQININGENVQISRSQLYYNMGDIIESDRTACLIWELYQDEYHFRYAIPEIYLK